MGCLRLGSYYITMAGFRYCIALGDIMSMYPLGRQPRLSAERQGCPSMRLGLLLGIYVTSRAAGFSRYGASLRYRPEDIGSNQRYRRSPHTFKTRA